MTRVLPEALFQVDPFCRNAGAVKMPPTADGADAWKSELELGCANVGLVGLLADSLWLQLRLTFLWSPSSPHLRADGRSCTEVC
eukprot:s3215_g5.t1